MHSITWHTPPWGSSRRHLSLFCNSLFSPYIHRRRNYGGSLDFVSLLNLMLCYDGKLWKSGVPKSQDRLYYGNLFKGVMWILVYGFSIIAPLTITVLNVVDPDRLPFLGSILPHFTGLCMKGCFLFTNNKFSYIYLNF